MELRFLYVGVGDTERDLAAWLALPGAALRWRFQHFGADVAGVDLGSPPLVLLADHRPDGTILPIYSVDDLEAAGTALDGTGWVLEAGPLGTPEGLATVWRNASGTELALLCVERPGALDGAFRDPEDPHAVRPTS